MKHNVQSALLVAITLSCGQLQAELVLPFILSDNMVLQRDKEIRIWGKGDDGETVTVHFNEQTKTAVVKEGQWLVSLDPEKADGPFDMTIRHGTDTRIIKNVLVGDVWTAGGQSNMQWSLSGSTHKEEAFAMPANDNIRVFKQEKNSQAAPQFDTLPARWMPSTPANRKHWSAVAYWFIQDIQKQLDVPVGLLLNCDGGTRTQYWTPLETFKKTPGFAESVQEALAAQASFEARKKQFEDDLAKFLRKRKAGEKTGPPPVYYGRFHCGYYNGMIHPIQNYAIRGAIWYQGERNSMTTEEALAYRRFFPLMIKGWRDVFREPELPFFFVQLPKMSPRNVRDLPTVRESQLLTSQNTLHTGMVVTIDVGEDLGLHPALKRPIGLRLAKLARAKVYGEDLEHSAPVFKRAEVQGKQVIVHFDDPASELVSSDGKPLREFTICGADHNFVAAQAKIIGNTVVVSNTKVSEPVAVRYAWKNDPIVNFFGRNGLPVGPFRTDSLKLSGAR